MSDVLSDYNPCVRLAGPLAETGTQTFENVSATGTLQAGTTVTAGTALVGQDVSISGLTGAVVATRYVGGTASVAPTTGTFSLGDWVVSSTGRMWVCTVAGTPGTWVEPASVAFAPLASPTFPAPVAVSKLAAGLAGQLIGGTGPAYAYPPGFEIAYDQITSGVNVVATAEGTPTAIIAGTSHTYEAVPYVAEFFSASVTDSSAAAGTVTVLLIADRSSIGRVAVCDSSPSSTQTLPASPGGVR